MVHDVRAKLQTLEKLCEAGYADEVLAQSLEKLLAYQRAQLQTRLQELEQDLRELETRYGLATAVFLERYQRGDMGDSADAVEWHALASMHAQLRHHLRLFQESDGGVDHDGLLEPGKGTIDQ